MLDIFEAIWIYNLDQDRGIDMDQRLFDCLRVRIREPFLIQAKKLQILIQLLFTDSTYREQAFSEVVLALLAPSPRLQLYTNQQLLNFIPKNKKRTL